MVLGIHKTKGEIGPNIKMSIFLSISHRFTPDMVVQQGFRKCYMMVVNDHLLSPQKKKIDHSLPLPYRRNTYNIHQFRRTLRGSHAKLQDDVAQKNHTAT